AGDRFDAPGAAEGVALLQRMLRRGVVFVAADVGRFGASSAGGVMQRIAELISGARITVLRAVAGQGFGDPQQARAELATVFALRIVLVARGVDDVAVVVAVLRGHPEAQA